MIIEALKRSQHAIGSGSRDMRVFVTGVGGQLGHDCVNELISRGHDAVGTDVQELKMADYCELKMKLLWIDHADMVTMIEAVSRLVVQIDTKENWIRVCKPSEVFA